MQSGRASTSQLTWILRESSLEQKTTNTTEVLPDLQITELEPAEMQHVSSMLIEEQNIYSSEILKADLKSMTFSSINKLLFESIGRTAADILTVLRQRYSKYR